MTDNPVDRLRKLEGACLTMLALDMGTAKKRRFSLFGPVCALLIAAFLSWLLFFA